MQMTKDQFVKELTKLLRETYQSVTEAAVITELNKQLNGAKPDNIIGMFVADNLKKITIVR
jgi:hypothetical protein